MRNANDTWSVLVHVPAEEGGVRQPGLNLWPGEAVTFGRGAADLRVDIRLDRPAVSRLAGRIEAVDFYWLLSNLSTRPNASYVVHNDEGRGEHFTIRPGERLPVPFTASRVQLLGGDSKVVEFKVFAMRRGAVAPPALPTTTQTVEPFRPLSVDAKHFLILVALCEPRLVYGSAAIPSIPDLLRRVQRTAAGRDLETTSAVNFHIEYLIDRLGLRGYEGLEDRRAALINRALWFGIVGEQHLELLAEV
ncbi:serine/threonine protein kinase [Nocardia huaxiensis]|uniref:Serine/threonine protein kinase n=1 Tax=Nocardia huaxiensis TaxID=2755382 RepID=A0A7D6V6I6_9NOCA|nr:serine/threonine protein kinase [Nocardia huaxiensis]QLY27571.1 serine/threonine protein kinase [Nocardia huaxiensis]UFS99052.1 hypothetical protein LPY97_14700 [Nocardia huaxiensis]